MIQSVEINTIKDAFELLSDVRVDERIGRVRNDYLYRGMASGSFELTTSLWRNCKDKQAVLEPSILRYFGKYGIIDEPGIGNSVWNQMIAGQHHGLPTRLLDWSHSSLVAMHFATSEKEMSNTDKRDGIIWRIDAKEISDLLPEKYKAVLEDAKTEIFSVDTLQNLVGCAKQYDEDMGDKAMVLIEPPSTDQRIINQHSCFSIIPMGITNIERFLDENTENTVRYIISRDIRWELRDILDQLNISERIIFPGLDGLSKWIARHYYVKD